MKPSELLTQAPRGESILIYGPPKTGKTLLAATLARTHRLHWFDLENGFSTVLKTPLLTPAEKDNIDVIQIPDTRANPVAIGTMLKVLSGNRTEVCILHGLVSCLACRKNNAVFQTYETSKLTRGDVVVVDSLTQLSDSAYNQVIGSDLDSATDIRDFGKSNQRLAMLLSFVQQAPFHTVFISHEKAVELEGETAKAGGFKKDEKAPVQEKIYPFAGTRNFSRNVAKFFGHVLYTEYKPSGFCVGASPEYKVNALIGNRSGLKWKAGESKLSDFLKG